MTAEVIANYSYGEAGGGSHFQNEIKEVKEKIITEDGKKKEKIMTETREVKVEEKAQGKKGWREPPIIVSCEPSAYTLPEEVFSFSPSETETHKRFFKNTPREINLRQIFLHQNLTNDEQKYLQDFRKYCKEKNYEIPEQLNPMLLRVLLYNRRKYGESLYLSKALNHLQEMYEWRVNYFPLSDKDEEISEDLHRGIMYWVGRDAALRPLLIIRLNRVTKGKHISPERFEKLTIFCFEWALRYLMVPGKVETCTVLVDTRGVPLLQVPASALKIMIQTLTKQYPFRLNKMWIIHDMYFVQALWDLMKQFLTEVQQEKISIYRNNVEADLANAYPLNQLEITYGGLRSEITSFYPFPLAAGPFTTASKEECNPKAYKGAWKACDERTAKGVMWEGTCRTPIQWAGEAHGVFADLNLSSPVPKTNNTIAVSEKAEKHVMKDGGVLSNESLSHPLSGPTSINLSRPTEKAAEIDRHPLTPAPSPVTRNDDGQSAFLTDEGGSGAATVIVSNPEGEDGGESAQQLAHGGGGENATAASDVKPLSSSLKKENEMLENDQDVNGGLPSSSAADENLKKTSGIKNKKSSKVRSDQCCHACTIQ